MWPPCRQPFRRAEPDRAHGSHDAHELKHDGPRARRGLRQPGAIEHLIRFQSAKGADRLLCDPREHRAGTAKGQEGESRQEGRDVPKHAVRRQKHDDDSKQPVRDGNESRPGSIGPGSQRKTRLFTLQGSCRTRSILSRRGKVPCSSTIRSKNAEPVLLLDVSRPTNLYCINRDSRC